MVIITAEAPKTASIIDDFRTEKLDLGVWTYTGAAPVVWPRDTATSQRGLAISPGTTVSAVNTLGGRRADFNDSEVVWVIGAWPGATTCTLSIEQGNYSYSFIYSLGQMTVRAIENGTLHEEVIPGSWGKLRYLRIAHSAHTGKIEFYAGTKADGSNQIIMTRDLGVTKGNLSPHTNSIDNMIIKMSNNTGTSSALFVRAVNAPAGGLARNPSDPTAYYVRDFNTWYARITNQFSSVVDTMTHEWKVLATNSSSAVQVVDAALTNRVLQVTGDGANRTILRTGFTDTIKDVSYEMTMTPLSLPLDDSYVGLMWRCSGDGAARYQLNIYKNSIELMAYYIENGTNTVLTSPKTSLITIPLVTNEGQTYKWRVSHYSDRVAVYRDDDEVLSFTELINFVRTPGHIGIDVGNTSGTATATVVAIDAIRVVPGYDESTFSTGIAFQDRGLGAHVKEGRRDQSPVTMATNPSIVGNLESKIGVPFKTVYHFTNYSNTVDSNTINAAKQHAREGRVNVIAWNSFGSDLLSAITSGSLDSVIDSWCTAFDTIPGTTYVAPLPYADLNVGWSPFAYTYTSTVSSATSTTLSASSPGWTSNQFAGGSVRWLANDGTMKYSTVTSNTSTTLTFANNGSTPAAGNKFWVRTNVGGGTAAQYRAAFAYIRDRFRINGCRASVVFAMNWAADTDTLTGAAYTGAFDDLYPGESYVDGFVIRAINQGLTPTGAATQWRSVAAMLQGGSYSGSLDYVPASGQTVYYKMNSASSEKKMFVIAGTAETHHRYNDFEYGFSTATVTTTNSGADTCDAFDSIFSGAGGSIKYWTPPNVGAYNPSTLSSEQRSVKFDVPLSGDEKYFTWNLPTSGVSRLGVSTYFRVEQIGSASSAGFLVDVRDVSAPICKVRLDVATGTITLTNPSGTTIGTLGTTVTSNTWYRLDLELSQSTSQVRLKLTPVYSVNIDRPDSSASSVTVSSFSINNPRYVRFGSELSNQSYAIRNGLEMDGMKVSWDTTAETYSKARWVDDALNTRGFPQVSRLILMSGDQVNDITTVNTSRFGGNSIDTRLDASKYTLEKILSSFNIADAERAHTRPQLRQSGYQPTAKVGNVEYMYLSETGHAPLYIVPRLGGVLLRDFNLGTAPARAIQEVRPGQDGVRDYTRYLGSKAVTLDFITFDDASGSAAYYSDVLATWMNPRRRPRLFYKMRDGEERSIALRPDTNGGGWTIDGVRSGFKEVQIQMVGIDGKDYATDWNEVLVRHGHVTEVNTPGTASTPPVIRIYGGSTGCLNPTITLTSEEARTGGASARISVGSVTVPIMVPANSFIEIDMHERTIQLNGLPYEGNSYLRHMTDRQWFNLEPYYNMVYFESDDGNGFAAVRWRDAYL